ncbi:DUF3108 domain-containing protein [Aliikangiella sp. IMCC44653]
MQPILTPKKNLKYKRLGVICLVFMPFIFSCSSKAQPLHSADITVTSKQLEVSQINQQTTNQAKPAGELSANISSQPSAQTALNENQANLNKNAQQQSLNENPDPINSSQEPLPRIELNRENTKSKRNHWAFLFPYTAKYTVISDGDKLGTATRSLKRTTGHWSLEIKSELRKWMLKLKSNEYSLFNIVGNELYTHKFFTSTKISFKDDREIVQDFNWDTNRETGKKDSQTWELSLDEHLYDRMSHIVQMRADLLQNKTEFVYLISYKGKRKPYRYTLKAKQKIVTEFGTFEALRFNRSSGDDGRFSIWFAPALNYFPIKIAQFEQDKPDVELILKTLSFENLE